MLMENRIRGVFVWTLSLIFLVLLIVKLIINPSSLAIQAITLYITINILLIFVGFYIFWLNYPVIIWLNSAIIFFGWILSTIMIYSSDGIKSPYFPFLYFMLLIYAAFSRGKLLLFLTGIFSLLIVGFWVYLSPDIFNQLIKQYFLLNFAVLLITIIIIRNYPLECLSCDYVGVNSIDDDCDTCDTQEHQCSNKKNCSVVNYKNN